MFQQAMLSTARQIIGTAKNQTGRKHVRLNRQGLIKSVVELIEDGPQAIPTVKTLAEPADVSERALRSAFHDILEASPKRFLNLRRLDDARRLLMDGTPDEISVTAVAANMGFWEFGRFAGNYRSLFGQLPSLTSLVNAVQATHLSEVNKMVCCSDSQEAHVPLGKPLSSPTNVSEEPHL